MPEPFARSTEVDVEASNLRLEALDYQVQAPTPRQLDILRLIADGTTALRAIGVTLGISSTNGVHDHLRALVKRSMLVAPPRGGGARVPYRLTPVGWCAIGPCACIVEGLKRGWLMLFEGRLHIAYGFNPAFGVRGSAFVCCPWCGRGLG